MLGLYDLRTLRLLLAEGVLCILWLRNVFVLRRFEERFGEMLVRTYRLEDGDSV
jgi:hypothetical protein